MIEYLYDAVRASDGEDMTITATIRDNDGTTITDGCALRIFDEGGALIEEVGGTYYTDAARWEFKFTFPTHKARARYFYTIAHNGEDMNFKARIYLV